ncbi:Hmr-1p [Cichlidogyrus casuarinus]|uniref:Hmr-1p n=1 Tax=Cichlidogyrus casuarinus TaxID=1844966 RepID=A0ABD2QF61_9PLAT
MKLSALPKLEANDGDSEGQLTYQLDNSLDSSELPFKVETSGAVIVARRLDFEKRSKYTLPIRVSDGDYEATTKLEISILDLNDELPRLSLTPTKLSIVENNALHVALGQVSGFNDLDKISKPIICKSLLDYNNLLFHSAKTLCSTVFVTIRRLFLGSQAGVGVDKKLRVSILHAFRSPTK